MSIGYMVPYVSATALMRHLPSSATWPRSGDAEPSDQDAAATGLYARGSPPKPTRRDHPLVVRQGMGVVQQSETVSVPYFMKRVEPRMRPVLNDALRRILSEPGSAKGFDLDALLARWKRRDSGGGSSRSEVGGEMSGLQRFFKRVLPAAWAESMEAESRRVDLTRCRARGMSNPCGRQAASVGRQKAAPRLLGGVSAVRAGYGAQGVQA